MIAPAGWAMSFWVPLVYSGARVGGLRELQTVSLHQASLLFPFDYPDSSAGKELDFVSIIRIMNTVKELGEQNVQSVMNLRTTNRRRTIVFQYAGACKFRAKF